MIYLNDLNNFRLSWTSDVESYSTSFPEEENKKKHGTLRMYGCYSQLPV